MNKEKESLFGEHERIKEENVSEIAKEGHYKSSYFLELPLDSHLSEEICLLPNQINPFLAFISSCVHILQDKRKRIGGKLHHNHKRISITVSSNSLPLSIEFYFKELKVDDYYSDLANVDYFVLGVQNKEERILGSKGRIFLKSLVKSGNAKRISWFTCSLHDDLHDKYVEKFVEDCSDMSSFLDIFVKHHEAFTLLNQLLLYFKTRVLFGKALSNHFPYKKLISPNDLIQNDPKRYENVLQLLCRIQDPILKFSASNVTVIQSCIHKELDQEGLEASIEGFGAYLQVYQRGFLSYPKVKREDH
ncbi:hypothetical protein M9H77_26815 [Catharanthus roseus]|uniref:Uncharacterized protein n=1 Tax=Catharanthus roseus TaxID=4058 RepID=A0ACC0ADG1_CATRO|nr:hypothetical protein M9H77_26815 [Catharanthus roseus]